MRQFAWRSAAAQSLMLASGGGDPREVMSQRARGVLGELGMTEPPFDPYAISSYCGVHEVREVSLEWAGCLVPAKEQGQGPTMLLRRQDHPDRRNFTCNHETAHTLIPSYWQGDQTRKDRRTGHYGAFNEEEHLCDVGAAELLMPAEPFRRCAREFAPGMPAVTGLAAWFCASLHATARRLIDLELWPGGLLLFGPDCRSPKSRYQPTRGPRLESLHLGPALERVRLTRGTTVCPSSLIGRCLRTGESGEGYQELEVEGSPHLFWVQCRRYGRPSRRRVYALVAKAPPSGSGA